MKISLIICTYMRPKPLLQLLQSVQGQTCYPDEILIVDGSTNQETEVLFQEHQFPNLHYFAVPPENRGLTKQRNYGIERVGSRRDLTNNEIEIVCFLDDDTVLENDYFEQIVKTYQIHPEALGVGGYITNESNFKFVGDNYKPGIGEFYFDGWKQKEGSRFIMRKILGLDSDCPPGFSSLFLMAGVLVFYLPAIKFMKSNNSWEGFRLFRSKVFENLQFSTYFEGYGLYEDADFTLRLSKIGKLYVNTAAKLSHFHAPDGRPNQYRYGKMVVRNGWYVWRVKNPKPSLKIKLKWHAITILLTMIRFSNTFTATKKKAAFTEALGRVIGWWSLVFNKPKINN